MSKKLNEKIADRILNYSPVSLDTLREWELDAIDLVTENAGHELMDAEADSYLSDKVVVEKETYEDMIRRLDMLDDRLARIAELANALTPTQMIQNAMAIYHGEEGRQASECTVLELIGFLKEKGMQ